MSRPMRIEYPGAVYHITARGNERKKINLDDRDREIYLKTIKQVKDRFHWLFHSYVLMGTITCRSRRLKPTSVAA